MQFYFAELFILLAGVLALVLFTETKKEDENLYEASQYEIIE